MYVEFCCLPCLKKTVPAALSHQLMLFTYYITLLIANIWVISPPTSVYIFHCRVVAEPDVYLSNEMTI